MEREDNPQFSAFYYHFKDKYDLVAWIFFNLATDVDVTSVKSAANHMNSLRQDYFLINRLSLFVFDAS